jgi:hypothetical protein
MWPAARFCAVAGVPIFPGLPSSKLPNVDQLGDGWSTTRIGTTDLEQVDLWWGADPFSNILAAMGFGPATTGWGGLDLDYRNGLQPVTQLAARCAELGVKVPQGARVRTPSGEHVHARLPERVRRFPKRPGYIPGAVDVAGSGAYLLLPPSRIRVLGDVPDDIPEGRRAAYAEQHATWKHYRWVRPGTPNPTDVYEAGPFAGTAADSPVPDLAPEDEWRPTIRELLAALGNSVWPDELVADVLTRPKPEKAAGGRTAPRSMSDAGLYRWDGPVPVDEWIEGGLPADLNHESLVKQASNCLAGRGWTVEEVTAALVHITDPRVTPLKKAGHPWRLKTLENKAKESVKWVERTRKAEAAERTEWSREWTS